MRARIALVLSLCCAPAFSAPAPPEALRLLAAVKSATGGQRWDTVKTWHERGSFRTGDLTGTYESWIDFPTRANFSDQRYSTPDLGQLSSTSGWNGRVSWSADQSGDVFVSESDEARISALTSAYLDTFAFLFPDRFPAAYAVLAPQTASNQLCDVLQITPTGLDPFELWIDRATHLPARVVELTGVVKATTVLSDYRPVDGLLIPFRNLNTGKNEATAGVLEQTESIQLNAPLPAGIFDPPAPNYRDVHFPAGRTSVTLDFTLIHGNIRIPVSLNGRPPIPLIFDTGSSNTLGAKNAEAIGLHTQVSGTSYGAGTGSAPEGLVKLDSIDIAGLVFNDQIVTSTDLPADPDAPVNGMLGYEVAQRAVVTIDYAARKITFQDPATFHPPAHFTAVPFRFADRSEILVPATLDGSAGEFQIDTGAEGSLYLNRPFALRNRLIEKYHPTKEAGVSGIGGLAKTVVFHPKRFELAGIRVKPSDAQIFVSETGGGVEEHVAGVIGAGILERFTLILDYRHRILYLGKARR